MKLLVIGGGGREHALAWKLAARRGCQSVCGARQRRHASDPRFSNVPYERNEALAGFAIDEQITLLWLVRKRHWRGVVDVFRAADWDLAARPAAAKSRVQRILPRR